MSVTAVSPLVIERRAKGRPAQASRLFASVRIWGDQVPAGTYAERNRNPIEGAEATGRHVLAQSWGLWS